MADIVEVINSLKPNTSPGIDGLSGEFYRKFQDKLAGVLENLFSDCLIRGRILASWLEARIVVIPKPDKELTLPRVYRPIS